MGWGGDAVRWAQTVGVTTALEAMEGNLVFVPNAEGSHGRV